VAAQVLVEDVDEIAGAIGTGDLAVAEKGSHQPRKLKRRHLRFHKDLLREGSLMSSTKTEWRIGRKGKLLNVERFMLAPEKIELVDGKLFWSDEARTTMLGLLLENVGIDEVIKLGLPRLWREAVKEVL